MAKYGAHGLNPEQWPTHQKVLQRLPRSYRPAKGVFPADPAPAPAPAEDEPVVVLPDAAPVVNEDSTNEAYDHRAELEALPDADLYEQVKDLDDFDPTWTRTDFIERLLEDLE